MAQGLTATPSSVQTTTKTKLEITSLVTFAIGAMCATVMLGFFAANAGFAISSLLGDSESFQLYSQYRLLCQTETDCLGEYGTIFQINDSTFRLNFINDYDAPPVVIAKPLSSNDSQPAHVRVVKVTLDYVELAVEEWDYQDGTHGSEVINYLVIKQGRHQFVQQGLEIEAGLIEGVKQNWTTRSFNPPFEIIYELYAGNKKAPAPIVLAQPQALASGLSGQIGCGYQIGSGVCYDGITSQEAQENNLQFYAGSCSEVSYCNPANTNTNSSVTIQQWPSKTDDGALVTRLRSVTKEKFQVRVQEEEAKDGKIESQRVGYIAINQTNATIDFWNLQSGIIDGVSHQPKTINVDSNLSAPPVFLADMQTMSGSDPASLRYTFNNNIISVAVQEEQSRDSEMTHGKETVGYILLSQPHAPVARLHVTSTDLPEGTSQNIIPGTTDVLSNVLVFDAGDSEEDIRISEVQVLLQASGFVAPADLSNFRISTSTNPAAASLVVANDPGAEASGQTQNGTSARVPFTLASPFIIPAGTQRNLYVFVDTSSDIQSTPGTAYQIGFASELGDGVVNARSDSDSSPVELTVSHGGGPVMNLVGEGSLIIAADTDNDQLIQSRGTRVHLASFVLTAMSDDVILHRFYLTGEGLNGGGWDQIQSIEILAIDPNGFPSLLAPITPTTTDSNIDGTVHVDFLSTPWVDGLWEGTTQPITIPAGQSVRFNISADTANANYEIPDPIIKNGESGEGIRLKINSPYDVYSYGSSNALRINNVDVSQAIGKARYLFRSVMRVNLNEFIIGGVTGGTLSPGVTTTDLYRFNIDTVRGPGPIGIGNVTFLVNTSTAQVGDFNLYRIYPNGQSVRIGFAPASLLPITTNSYYAFIPFAFPGPFGDFLDEAIVAPDSIASFVLRGTLSCLEGCQESNGSGSVSIQFLGDGTPLPVFPDSAKLGFFQIREAAAERSFQWTDFWRTPVLLNASSTAITAEQWTNGYLVLGAGNLHLQPTSTAVIFSR
jgi:hypothetical protein